MFSGSFERKPQQKSNVTQRHLESSREWLSRGSRVIIMMFMTVTVAGTLAGGDS